MKRSLILGLLGIAIFNTSDLAAQDTHRWTSPNGPHDWDDASNWDLGKPGPTDNVLFDLNSQLEVNLNQDEQVRFIVVRMGDGSLLLTGGNTIQVFDESLVASGTLTFQNGTHFASSNDLLVGDNGVASFILSSSSATNRDAILGATATGIANAHVTGAGSIWNNRNLFLGNTGSGFNTGVGHLTVDSGSRVNVGAGASTFENIGLAIIDDPNGASPSEGNLFLRNGSTVLVEDGVHVGRGGNVSVHGDGTSFSTDGSLLQTSGNISLSGGGVMESRTGEIRAGDFLIDGTGSAWNSAMKIDVELDGALIVREGGTVATGELEVGGAGNPFSTSSALVSVQGAGSRIDVDGEIGIARQEGGHLLLTDGGVVSASNLFMSYNLFEGGVGSLTVRDAGSLLQVESIDTEFASASANRVLVSDGGRIVANEATLRFQSVRIEDAGSEIDIDGDVQLGASLQIVDGGQLSNHTARFLSGNTLVEGVGSKWSNRNLMINTTTGNDDRGTLVGARLTITSDGKVVVGDEAESGAAVGLIVSDSGTDGNFVLRDGGRLENDTDTIIGKSVNSQGQVIVDGEFDLATDGEVRATALIQQGHLTIGEEGAGELQISQGAMASALGGTIGQRSQGSGVVQVSDEGSLLEVNQNLTVGGNGEGRLQIQTGATVDSATGSVGSHEQGEGLVTISGPGSAWKSNHIYLGSSDGDIDGGIGSLSVSDGGQLLVGKDHERTTETQLVVSDGTAPAELIIRNGSTLDGLGTATVGRSVDAAGAVLVSGKNSVWSNAGDVVIGKSGNGILQIADQASMMAGETATIGADHGAFGSVAVTGSGSFLGIATGLNVGKDGTGELLIADKGLVVVPNVNVGSSSTGSGEVRVTGTGSELRSETSLSVGGGNAPRLYVEDGGLVNSGHGSVSTTNSVATVSGIGSRWLNAESLSLWDGGTLIVENGGQATGGSESTVNAGAHMKIRGTGSEFSSQVLNVGAADSSVGSVLIEDQGKLVSSSAFVGSQALTSGLVTVRDQGSRWEANSINVGSTGTGEVRIENGAQVQAISGFIGRFGEGRVTVTGGDSVWDLQQYLSVGWGSNGKGYLTIENGGRVETLAVGTATNTGTQSIIKTSGQGSRLDAEQYMTIGSEGVGVLRVEDQAIATTRSATLGATSSGTGSVIVSGNSDWQIVNTLKIAPYGVGELYVSSGGFVTVGDGVNTGRTTIGEFGSVYLDQGGFDFGTTDLESFGRISGTSGSLFGALEFDGYRHIEELSIPSVDNLNVYGVRAANSGVIYGQGATGLGLQNLAQGEVRTLANQWTRFGGVGNSNRGELTNLGGTLEFEADLTNVAGGFISGRGQFIADNGITNEGVMAFSAGFADVFGDVANVGQGQVVTSGFGTTTFFDDVIHNGSEIRTSAGSSTVFFGEYSGAGAFTGTGAVFFEGDLRLGNSPDVVSFGGDVSLGADALSEFELGGLTLGQFDRLEVAGDFTIDGELLVTMIDGFKLFGNQHFTIVDIGGQQLGQFNGLSEGGLVGTFGDRELFISYSGGDGNDVSLFTAVPEPSSAVVLLLAMGTLGLRRRRR